MSAIVGDITVSGASMHLVFISSLIPVAAPQSGFDIANRVIVDALVAMGHKVSILGFHQPKTKPAFPQDTVSLGELEVTNAKVGKLQKIKWLLSAIVRGTTVSSAKMYKVSEKTIASHLQKMEPFDGLILNSVQLPFAFFDVFKERPYIYIAHNVEAKSAWQNARRATSKLESALFSREARLLEVIEEKLCKNARHVWTLTKDDQNDLKFCEHERSSVIPLVTSIEPAKRGSVDKKYDVTMLGSWSWLPNLIGLQWFVEEVVPHLGKNISIAIAGGIGAPIKSPHKGISYLGFVDDAHAFICSGAVTPLVSRSGTGVQLKTIEVFELGQPCVATKSSLRGVSHLPKNCVESDQPKKFAAAIMSAVNLANKTGEIDSVSGAAFHKQQLANMQKSMKIGVRSLDFKNGMM